MYIFLQKFRTQIIILKKNVIDNPKFNFLTIICEIWKKVSLNFWKIDSDWKFGFGSIRIDVSELIGLSWIDFRPFFIKRITKRFSDWFRMIRIGSDTDIGIVLIDSEWISVRYFRQGVYLRPLLSSTISQMLKRKFYIL